MVFKKCINIGKSTLYEGDTFEVMESLRDKSFDVIFADLPYGTTKCPWDTVIDLERIWSNYKRLIKDSGVILLSAQVPFNVVLGMSNLEWLKYEWIWEKTQATGHYNAKNMPMKAHENIMVFYKKLPYYNPQKTIGHKPINSYTKKADVANKTEVYGKVNKDISGGGETDRYPRSVQVFASDKQKRKSDGTIHSTQKPLALLEYLMNTYAKPGFTVLDNTTGSGTTNEACEKLGIYSVGIDNDPKSISKAVKRLNTLYGVH